MSGAPTNHDQKFTYDNLHRLDTYDEGTISGGSISNKRKAQDWTLDQLGNWTEFNQDDDGTGWDLEQTRNHNAANEITSISQPWESVLTDAVGNMTFVPHPKSLSSSLSMIVYDAWNRLVLIYPEEPDQVRYEYDGLHRRIEKDVNVGGSTDDRHDYYNEEWQLLEVRKTETGNPVEHLVWHPYYIDALAVRFHNSNGDTDFGDTDERQFVLQDANFNVTAIVNNSGDVLERYHYTPYGEVTFLDEDFDDIGSSAIANTHLYTGRERNPETGLQLNRHRFYRAPLGRWLTPDPIAYEGGSANLYEYVDGMPTQATDPRGLRRPAPRPVRPRPKPRPPRPDPGEKEEPWPGTPGYRPEPTIPWWWPHETPPPLPTPKPKPITPQPGNPPEPGFGRPPGSPDPLLYPPCPETDLFPVDDVEFEFDEDYELPDECQDLYDADIKE